MELIRGTGTWANWWEITAPSAKVLDYIRYSVPVNHRSYDSDTHTWRVHEKYVDPVRTLMQSSGFAPTEDPYEVLHLRPTAPQAIIKAAFRELVKELHPDHGGDAEQFKRVNDAYHKLVKV